MIRTNNIWNVCYNWNVKQSVINQPVAFAQCKREIRKDASSTDQTRFSWNLWLSTRGTCRDTDSLIDTLRHQTWCLIVRMSSLHRHSSGCHTGPRITCSHFIWSLFSASSLSYHWACLYLGHRKMTEGSLATPLGSHLVFESDIMCIGNLVGKSLCKHWKKLPVPGSDDL